MYNRHRPAAVVNIRAGLTSEGKVGLWECKVFGAGEWASETRYDFPNQRISWAGHWSNSKPNPPGMQPIGVGPWRGPAATSNTFAKETMMDELAVLAGVDPAEFRLRHLEGDKRLARVFQAALDQFGYQPGKSPSGRGIGISCAHLYNTYTCSVAQVEVNKQTGAIKVLRVVNAVDCGVIVNPLGATMQMESAIIFGMGTALFDEVRFKEGKFEQTNFDGCEIPRFSNLPKMEVVLVKSELQQPLGLGEPPVCSVAPAIANAVHDALGVRIRHLPMTPERIMAALQGASQ
jgi:isoquinoline 1-oxidoreductase